MASETSQPHAFEAIAHDTVSLLLLFTTIRQHRKAALLLPGLLPFGSMFVVESHRCLTKLIPELGAVLSKTPADWLRPSRHRAKLLDAKKSLEAVAGDLLTVAEQQRGFFLALHTGFWGPLKRAIQPDLGLSTYDGHIFSTTHATAFSFGENRDPATSASSDGEALGAYLATLAGLFQIQMPRPLPGSALPGAVEMRDIKTKALYQRGPLGAAPTDLAAAMTFLLVNLNQVHYIMRRLLPPNGHTLFRLKFIVAYHADSNLRSIQSRLASRAPTTRGAMDLLREVLGNSDSRWLRKRDRLRGLLTHYMADPGDIAAIPANATRTQVIECLASGLLYNEIDELLDRHIARMSTALEAGFCLSGDPFWYGRVT